MGILGENRITCSIDDQPARDTDEATVRICACCCLVPGVTLLILLCVTLLTNDAAQNMAAWTFEGDHKAGAVVGLVLIVSFFVLCYVWLLHRKRNMARLVADCPLVAESDIPAERLT